MALQVTNGRTKVLYFSFNQEGDCISVGLTNGFVVYGCDPFRPICRRELDGGIGIAEMLWKSNYMALVGGGDSPWCPRSQLCLWNDNDLKPFGEIPFPDEICAVRMRKDRVAVSLLKKIFVYRLTPLEIDYTCELNDITRGLFSISTSSDEGVLAFPAIRTGSVHIHFFNSKREAFVTAHDSELRRIALSRDGTLLATASAKGTVIRVFNTADGSLKKEVQRGTMSNAVISGLSFSADNSYLACTSSTGTVHIFATHVDSPATNSPSDSSGGGWLGNIGKLVAPAQRERALAWYKGSGELVGQAVACSFGVDGQLNVVSESGAYLKLSFPQSAGECSVQRAGQVEEAVA